MRGLGSNGKVYFIAVVVSSHIAYGVVVHHMAPYRYLIFLAYW